MNFGTGIAITLGLFMSFISYLAYRSFQENVDLVAENYYEQEVAYQETIDGGSKTLDLEGKVFVSSDSEDVLVEFPIDFKGLPLSGNVKFICPSDKKNDVELTFETTEKNSIALKRENFVSGPYRLQLRWNQGGTDYYHEELVVL